MARAMKPSGVEWLGDIPADWDVCRLKYCLSTRLQYGANSSGVTFKENLPRYIRITDISSAKTLSENNKLSLGLDEALPYLLDDKDILFARSGATVGKAFIYSSDIGAAAFAGYLIRAKLNPLKLLPEFLLLFTQSNAYDEWRKQIFIQSTIQNIAAERYNNLLVPRPPLDEQQRIAAFLDDKCARIDSVVEKTRASIEEYRKLKQAIITRAVTKGIRPNRPTKDSGIDWLGDIPADWELARLKRFIFVNNGRETLDEVDKTEDVVPVYGSGGVFKYTTTPLYSGETVMFGRKGTLGKPIYANEKLWTVDTMYFLTFSEKLFAKFNYYQLCAFDWEPHITQTALPSIVASEIVSCKFAFPPLDEQKEIAAYLDEKTAAIDSLVAKKNRLVSELESLKKSLIFEYVTGKKEVPT